MKNNFFNPKEDIKKIEDVAGATVQSVTVQKRLEKYDNATVKNVTLVFPNENIYLKVDKQGVIHRAETDEKVLWTNAKNANIDTIGREIKKTSVKEFSKVTPKQMEKMLSGWSDKAFIEVGDFLIKNEKDEYLQEGRGVKWTKRLSLSKRFKRLPNAIKVASSLAGATIYKVEKIEE